MTSVVQMRPESKTALMQFLNAIAEIGGISPVDRDSVVEVLRISASGKEGLFEKTVLKLIPILEAHWEDLDAKLMAEAPQTFGLLKEIVDLQKKHRKPFECSDCDSRENCDMAVDK